jgi:hypothetical protein
LATSQRAAQNEVWVAVDRDTGQLTGAHQLYYSMGFERLTERETRIVDGHTRPLRLPAVR